MVPISRASCARHSNNENGVNRKHWLAMVADPEISAGLLKRQITLSRHVAQLDKGLKDSKSDIKEKLLTPVLNMLRRCLTLFKGLIFSTTDERCPDIGPKETETLNHFGDFIENTTKEASKVLNEDDGVVAVMWQGAKKWAEYLANQKILGSMCLAGGTLAVGGSVIITLASVGVLTSALFFPVGIALAATGAIVMCVCAGFMIYKETGGEYRKAMEEMARKISKMDQTQIRQFFEALHDGIGIMAELSSPILWECGVCGERAWKDFATSGYTGCCRFQICKQCLDQCNANCPKCRGNAPVFAPLPSSAQEAEATLKRYKNMKAL